MYSLQCGKSLPGPQEPVPSTGTVAMRAWGWGWGFALQTSRLHENHGIHKEGSLLLEEVAYMVRF